LPKVVITRRAREQIALLPAALLGELDRKLLDLEAAPDTAAYALRGRLKGRLAARVSTYRLLLRWSPNRKELILESVLNRPRAYLPGRHRRS
jgi:mRNA-degrading endonuclease RelE of RelBE toxin-antitoxin system